MSSTDSQVVVDHIDERDRVPTVVVGAGQAGLATAYFLGLAGHRCLVLHEHHRVGDNWRTRYDSLRLNTPARFDSLPGTPFPAPRNSFPTAAEMGDYLERYVHLHAIDVTHDTVVSRIDRLGDGSFRLTCRDRVLHADNVVVATGGEHHPRVPDLAHRLDPGIRQLHSSSYRNPSQLLPGPVLVVGAGQSGADLALEAVGQGHRTWLSGRSPGEIPVDLDSFKARLAAPVLWFLANHVLTLRTPIGRRMQAEVRSGAAPLIRVKARHLEGAGVTWLEARTTGVVDGRPQLDDGTVLDVANVIWCTGFRQEFGFIHPPVVREDGWPRDRAGVVTEAPGLYFMGLLFQRGFYSMLVGGAGRDARRIAREIRSRSRVRT